MSLKSLLPALLFTFSSVLAPFLSSAQFTVYTTLDDLKNDTPKVYPDHDFRSRKGKSDTKIIIQDKSTKEKIEIDCTRIWGFSYKGQLFRVMRKGKYLNGGLDNFPVILSLHNGAFYWLNGFFLESLKKGNSRAELHSSYTGFISASVDGDAMLVTGLMKGPGWVKKNGDQFFLDHPQLEWLRDCSKNRIKNGYLHAIVEGCVQTHTPTAQ